MILHNVYFWLKEEVSEEEGKEFEKGLKALVSGVDLIHKAEIGSPADTPDREVVDHSFGYSLFIWFKSVEGHNQYQSHPAHDEFVEAFSGLWAEVKVFDSKIL